MKFTTSALTIAATLSLAACVLPTTEQEHDDDHEGEHHHHCPVGQVELTSSDGRDLCVELASIFPLALGAGPAAPGKVEHNFRIYDAHSNAPLDVRTDARLTSLSVYPLMTMTNGHSHSTPYQTSIDSSDAANGNYRNVVYYLMPSSMNGTTMGSWQYQVQLKDIGADLTANTGDDRLLKANFNPNLAMIMGGNKFLEKTERRSSGVYDDKILAMDMASSTYRMYGIWLDSVSNNNDGSHALQLFIHAKNMMPGQDHNMAMDMYSYPGLKAGLTMTDENTNAVTIDAVTVEVSAVANPAPTDWITLGATLVDGYYAANISGLATDAQTTLQVRVTVTSTVNGISNTEEMSVAGSDATMPTLIFTAPQ
ncbi:MAG: hypothetical protein OEW58_08355 [Gammaproteobacteria bacterium]|nr:hypothetical protein [Gammaproteobacteria bacterium]